MPRKPDFFAQMDRADLERLEAFAREPSCTVKRCHEWLLAQGFTMSESAVQRWKKRFDETDGFAAAAEFADAVYTAQAETGGVDLTKAAMLQLSQRLVNRLASGVAPEDTKGMYMLARMLESLSRTGRHNVKFEQELSEWKAKRDAAIQAGEAAAKAGASAEQAINEVRRLLGVGT